MSTKYLDSEGLLYFWQKIKNLFATKAQGVKTISRDGTTFTVTRADDTTFTFTQQDTTYNDATTTTHGLMSTADKIKLDGIEAGAEVNQDAFSDVVVGSTVISANSASSTFELAGDTNITLTPDTGNKKVTISTTAEANQNAFTTVRVNGAQGTPVSATATEDVLNLTAGDNIAFSGNASTKTIQISATDTTYESKTAASGGTAVSLVTTGEKYTWNNKASTASPTFTGTPKAPTPVASSNDTTIATTEYVTSAVAAATTGAVAYQGTVPITGQTGGFAPANTVAGWYWIVATAGTYAGQPCEAGDMIFCRTGAATYSESNFDVIQTNLDITSITNGEIDTIVAS